MNEEDKITELSEVASAKRKHHWEAMPKMPYDPQYANAYVPIQQFTGIMSPEKALICGTAFQELAMPYGGWKTRLSW